MIWPCPKRILMTADTIGGVWTYSVELARALAVYDIEVALATMGREPTPQQVAEVTALGNTQLFASEFRLEWMEEPWQDVAQSGQWLLMVAEEFKPGLIHLNTFVHGALPWKAPVLMVGHSCVFSWWQAVHGARPPAQWDMYHSLVRRGLRAANSVVAPSFAMTESLQHFYGPLPNCELIPNGIASFSTPVQAAKESFILSAGRLWDEAKNIRVLAQIASELPWKIVVAGDCGENVPANLICLGELPRDELAKWQQCSAIYAAPAKYEPFGLSILEAASAGCALILGDIPSLRENWDGAAEFVDPADPHAWAQALTNLIANKTHRANLALRARERASEFTMDRMINAYLSAYSQAMMVQTALAVA
jgi:glycogen synthase